MAQAFLLLFQMLERIKKKSMYFSIKLQAAYKKKAIFHYFTSNTGLNRSHMHILKTCSVSFANTFK